MVQRARLSRRRCRLARLVRVRVGPDTACARPPGPPAWLTTVKSMEVRPDAKGGFKAPAGHAAPIAASEPEPDRGLAPVDLLIGAWKATTLTPTVDWRSATTVGRPNFGALYSQLSPEWLLTYLLTNRFHFRVTRPGRKRTSGRLSPPVGRRPTLADTEEVTGSIPVSPTSNIPSRSMFLAPCPRLVPLACPLTSEIRPHASLRP